MDYDFYFVLEYLLEYFAFVSKEIMNWTSAEQCWVLKRTILGYSLPISCTLKVAPISAELLASSC